MKIETDRYLITSDDNNIIVQTKGIVKDSPMLKDKSKIGQESLSEKRFYPNLKVAYGALPSLLLKQNEIDSFEQIIALHEELISDVKSLMERM